MFTYRCPVRPAGPTPGDPLRLRLVDETSNMRSIWAQPMSELPRSIPSAPHAWQCSNIEQMFDNRRTPPYVAPCCVERPFGPYPPFIALEPILGQLGGEWCPVGSNPCVPLRPVRPASNSPNRIEQTFGSTPLCSSTNVRSEMAPFLRVVRPAYDVGSNT